MLICRSFMRQLYYSFPRALPSLVWMLLLVAFTPSTAKASDCKGSLSPCVNLEPLWSVASPSPFLSVNGLSRNTSPQRLALLTSWQHLPLRLTAASSDPFGREHPVLRHWLTSQLSYAAALTSSLTLGAVASAGWVVSGTQLEGLSSRESTHSPRLSFGDPRLVASWDLLSSKTRQLRVIQQLMLPWGARRSWLSASGVTYAPGLAWMMRSGDWAASAEIGARLRPAVTLGDVRFGSSGWLALGVHRQLGTHWGVAAELFSTPALERSQTQTKEQKSSLRPIPTGWLTHVSFTTQSHAIRLGVGGSLPLTTRTVEQAGNQTSQSLAGPPGPDFRLSLQVVQFL